MSKNSLLHYRVSQKWKLPIREFRAGLLRDLAIAIDFEVHNYGRLLWHERASTLDKTKSIKKEEKVNFKSTNAVYFHAAFESGSFVTSTSFKFHSVQHHKSCSKSLEHRQLLSVAAHNSHDLLGLSVWGLFCLWIQSHCKDSCYSEYVGDREKNYCEDNADYGGVGGFSDEVHRQKRKR